MSTRVTIKLAQDGFCIAERDVAKLPACKTIKARLTGPGFDEVRSFALVDVAGDLYFADTITGTLYDDAGEHHTSPRLKLRDLPNRVKRGDMVEVEA